MCFVCDLSVISKEESWHFVSIPPPPSPPSPLPPCIMFFCANNAASRSIILSCAVILYKKLKSYSTQSFKECLFFVFLLLCLLLLSHSTLYLMFVCFDWKIPGHLEKINKTVKTVRVSNWIGAQSWCLGFTSFNIPTSSLPKTTKKLLL